MSKEKNNFHGSYKKGVPFWSKIVWFGPWGRASLYKTLLSTLCPPPLPAPPSIVILLL